VKAIIFARRGYLLTPPHSRALTPKIELKNERGDYRLNYQVSESLEEQRRIQPISYIYGFKVGF
jgi:hypothetical protein